jgi:sensor histidine kinase YesM
MKRILVVLLHVSYWLIYSLIVLLVWAGGQRYDVPPRLEGLAAIKVILHVIFVSPLSFLAFWPGVLGFYSYYFALFDKFLAKKKFVKLVASAILISAFVPVLLETILALLKPRFHFPLLEPGIGMAVICSVNGVLGLVIKGFVSWYDDIRVKTELNKKNHEMELALMKAQLNPHFLFNTINNIDVLIQKDPSAASEYLNKLSDILRYVLYENKTGKIPLAQELEHIQNFIELHKIRTSNASYVKLEVTGKAGNLPVEPMLFVPFIENAFKHADNKKLENAIRIHFIIEDGCIKFQCANTFSDQNRVKPADSGLGNELIRRRILLLYPGRHRLETSDKNGIYTVNLEISPARED